MKKKHRHPILPGWALGLLGVLPAAAAFWFLALPGACPSDGTSSLMQSAGSAAEELLFGILPFPAEPEPPAPDLAEAQPPKEDPVPESTLRARALLEEMSPEDKVGQMFIARYPAENAAGKASAYRLGGYILFARDFENRSPKQAAAQIQACQDAAGIPMLIAVDEEGGKVNRVSRYPAFRPAPFPSSQTLYENGGFDAVRLDTLEKSRLLKSLGINVNFAPVCDISQDPADFIYDRSFGKDASLTCAYVETAVQAMKEEQMGCVLKHFPGYGNNADTHTGISYDRRPYETFTSSDFLPFQAGIESGADMVLVSHNIVDCMDAQLPASLSPEVHRILREELGFSGVIVTDDLAMDGIRTFTGDTQAAVQAVLAGNDLLCCTDFETQIPAVLQAVETGEISMEQIDASVLRILELKISLGILL